MSVKEYIDKYMDIATNSDGKKYLVVKGTNIFVSRIFNDKINDELIRHLAECEIVKFGSVWDSNSREYIPADFGYSERDNKGYCWFPWDYVKQFNTKEEAMKWFYKN